MIRNFLVTALRYLSRSRFFTMINVAGLTIGISCCLVIYLYIRHELSVDQFQKDRDITYRVLRQSTINDAPYAIGVTSGPYLPALLQDYANEIEDGTRALPFEGLIEYGEDRYLEENLLLADRNFFQFFSFPLIEGDPTNVLTQPNHVVLSSALARKIFGDEDPIGKVLTIDREYDLLVTGIFDPDFSSHLVFDLVASIAIVEKESFFSDWWSNSMFTYIKVSDPQKADFLNAQFPSFMDKYFGKDFERVGNRIGLMLEPLRDIYFNGETRYERSVIHGDRDYIGIFSIVGIMLMALAAINYVNLATAQSSVRAKEIGIRKTLGSGKVGIVFQFLSESFVLTTVAVILAFVIVYSCLPAIATHFGVQLQGMMAGAGLLPFLLLLTVAVTLLAGSYPSFLMSALQPVRILKGAVTGELRYLLIRKGLIVFQFSISIFMIIATFLVNDQLKFMREKDMGFRGEQVMVVDVNNGVIGEKIDNFKQQLEGERDVVAASALSGAPGGFFDATTVAVEGLNEQARMRTLWTDENFVEALAIKVVEGRTFSEAYLSDRDQAVLMNETAVKELGWSNDEAIGKRVMLSQFDSTYRQIVGVVGDFHISSLKQSIEPLIISYGGGRRIAVKLSGEDVWSAVKAVEQLWDSYESGYPMEWTFLNDSMNAQYQNEVRQSKLFSLFAMISVFIACLGILGLTTFLVIQRKKEIGIRKIMGASPTQLSLYLMKDMLILVLVANAIAIPLGYFSFVEWLQGFAYRMELGPVNFIFGGLAVLLLAAFVVGIRTARAVADNPIESLRSE